VPPMVPVGASPTWLVSPNSVTLDVHGFASFFVTSGVPSPSYMGEPALSSG